ncbi:MAG: glycosyltransferase [Microgenomates group bacterium]
MNNIVTILIITKNSQATLGETLRSAKKLTDTLLVVDDYSTDKTCAIARTFGATVVRRKSAGFADQRAFALTQVATEWTLVLDSDEILTDVNIEELNEALLNPTKDGYSLHFRNHLFGKRLIQGELHKKLVLFKTKKAHIKDVWVHEQYEVDGKVGELQSEVIHNSYRSPLQILVKFMKYALLQAKDHKKNGTHVGMRELFLNPLHMFYARFIEDKGYLDGLPRFFLDVAFAKMEFFSYALIPFVKRMPRIAVDCGNYPVSGIVQSGIDRLIQGIYKNSSNSYEYHWFGFHKDASSRLPSRLFSQVWLPLATILTRSDIFYGVSGTIPHLLKYFRIKKVLFLYDFGFLHMPKQYGKSALRLKRQTEDSIRIADEIVFLHKALYQEFTELFPEFAHKGRVIPSGADHLENVVEIPIAIRPEKPLLLSVGVVKPVKRTDRLLSVVGDRYTVLAGPQEKKYADSLHLHDRKNIQSIEGFNDGQLKWLYTHADVLLNTSESEGFCYPVLEALTLGLPVIAFDLPLFREYKNYFPHLILVGTETEMKEHLKTNQFKKNVPVKSHPYRWSEFARSLVPPRRWPDGASGTKVGFIVILYKTTTEEKERLEKEIRHMGIKDFEIYWIDNSTNGKGYAAGINEGIRKGLVDNCDIFFAMNPDISLKGITAERLLEAKKQFDVWGYAMKQDAKTYYGGTIDKWRLSGGLIVDKPSTRFNEVDFVSASIIGFTSEVVGSIGFWDESYFMYYEDVDFCLRAHRGGFAVGVDSGVDYTHFEVSQFNKKKESWIAQSRWRFFWKYANSLQKIRELVRLPKTLSEHS